MSGENGSRLADQRTDPGLVAGADLGQVGVEAAGLAVQFPDLLTTVNTGLRRSSATPFGLGAGRSSSLAATLASAEHLRDRICGGCAGSCGPERSSGAERPQSPHLFRPTSRPRAVRSCPTPRSLSAQPRLLESNPALRDAPPVRTNVILL